MLEKDPERRISLRTIMAHPWVTLDGRWPCRSIHDLRGTGRKPDDMLDELPGGDILPVANHRMSIDWGNDRLVSMDFMATANVVDLPDEDWLTPVAASAEEHPLQAGEVLLRQGETGTSMFYVVEGELDVILKLRSLGGSSKGDTDETPVAELPSTIVEAALRAQDLISRRKVGKREFVVTTRGAGEFVGVMSLFSAPPVRVATVRAKTAARVRVIPLQHLLGYLSVRGCYWLLLARWIHSAATGVSRGEESAAADAVEQAERKPDLGGTGTPQRDHRGAGEFAHNAPRHGRLCVMYLYQFQEQPSLGTCNII